MSNERIGGFGDLDVFKRHDKYFIKYDAGAHFPIWREDEITHHEAMEAIKSPNAAIGVLKEIKKRLIDSGQNPHESNIKNSDLEI